jgi:16S rRNA (cytosine967-C5)-methyltransferase
MTGQSRILDNQRRTVLELISIMERRLRPGVPFLAELRGTMGQHRGLGSRDRRIYRELVFSWLRFREWFDEVRRDDPFAAVDLLVALSADTPDLAAWQTQLGVPPGLPQRPWPQIEAALAQLHPNRTFALRDLLPKWFELHCPPLFEPSETIVQLRRPPFWLRAQRGTAAELVRELTVAKIDAVVETSLPGAVRVLAYVDLEEHPIVTSGQAEIQDIGSQALVLMAAPAAGSRWLDFCAGAGGKTLQLASAVGSTGHVTAHDVRRDALMETKRRVVRAGLKNVLIEPVLPDPGAKVYDGVFVDAPCSATGTWRRHPFLRHQTTPAVVNRYVQEQVRLLDRASLCVAPAGNLVYATCSLSQHENRGVLAAFLRTHRDFEMVPPPYNPGLPAEPSGAVTIMPSSLDSDGYFLACMRRKS